MFKLLILAIIVLVIAGCTKSGEIESTGTEPDFLALTESLTEKIAAENGAITDWEDDLFYTLQLQQRMLSSQPILFRGYVDDIFARDEAMFVRFSYETFYFPRRYFVFELECSQSFVESIIAEEMEHEFGPGWVEYIVVADIEEISMPIISIESWPISEDLAEISYTAPTLFTARGFCVDIERVHMGRD